MPTVLTGIRTPSSGGHSSPVYSQDCLLDASGTFLKNTVSGPHATSVRLEGGGKGLGICIFRKPTTKLPWYTARTENHHVLLLP